MNDNLKVSHLQKETTYEILSSRKTSNSISAYGAISFNKTI